MCRRRTLQDQHKTLWDVRTVLCGPRGWPWGAGTRPSSDAPVWSVDLALQLCPFSDRCCTMEGHSARSPLCRPDSRILSRVKKGDGQGSLVSNSWQISSWVFTILSYFICLKSFQKKKWNFLVSLILILNFSPVCLFALCSGKFSNLFLTFGQHAFTSVTSLLISVFF